jgi:hypothetical protein
MPGLAHAGLKLALKMGLETIVSIDRFQGLAAFVAQAHRERPSLGLSLGPALKHHFQMEWIRLIVEYRIPQATTNKMIHTR